MGSISIPAPWVRFVEITFRILRDLVSPIRYFLNKGIGCVTPILNIARQGNAFDQGFRPNDLDSHNDKAPAQLKDETMTANS